MFLKQNVEVIITDTLQSVYVSHGLRDFDIKK
jgi:hypothetical protein